MLGFIWRPEQCTATVEMHGDAEIDYAVIHHAGADVDRCSFVIRTNRSRTLGLPMERSSGCWRHSFYAKSGSSSASRCLYGRNSIKSAAELALEKWQQEERPTIVTYQYRPPATTRLTLNR